MAITRITGNAAFNAGDLSVAAAVTTGATNRLILAMGQDANTAATFTIADTAGNSWSTVNAKITQASAGASQSWWAISNGTGATTVTVTITGGSGGFCILLVDVFAGTDTTAPISAANTAIGATGSPTGSVTPVDNDCAIWAAAVDSVTAVGTIGGSAATKGADDTQGDWSIYRVLTGNTGVSQTCAPTGSSGTYMLHMAAIRPPSTAVVRAVGQGAQALTGRTPTLAHTLCLPGVKVFS